MNTFNEANTIEDAICDRLTSLSDLKWIFMHGADLPSKPQDVLLENFLKDALCRLNPAIGESPDKADQVIYKLRAILQEAAHSGLVRSNELFTEWLRNEKSMPLGKDHEHITINMIDYDDFNRNHYLVSRQVSFIGNSAKKAIFDLVLYVNGIPLIVGELKRSTRSAITWQDGAADFVGGDKHYWDNQKSFFVPNLLCFATEGKTFRYGAIYAGFNQWMPWYETTDDIEIPQDIQTVLTSVEKLLNPQTLLTLLQSFALYSTKKSPDSAMSKLIKILPRYPQYEAAVDILKRVKFTQIRKGLIEHFQGSGKSLLMLYAAKMIKTDQALKNPTVIVVVDRKDLDSQINMTFDNANVKNVTAVRSCKQLSNELKVDSRNILLTTIFKFHDIEINDTNHDGLNARENIIVLVDEAHRTQEGMLAEKMRWALPNAYFFGLTGTPISSIERNTYRLFGADEDPNRRMNYYSYKQSIRDKATLPVKFDSRLVELRIAKETINKEFELLAEAHNLSEEEKSELSQKAGKIEHLLKSPKRLKAITDDIYEHFTSHVAPKSLKAMAVVYDRESCILMYNLLSQSLGEGACEVVMKTKTMMILQLKNPPRIGKNGKG